MPPCLATPVLQVDTNVIHQVDTQNPDNLFSMWTGKSPTLVFWSRTLVLTKPAQFLPSAPGLYSKVAASRI